MHLTRLLLPLAFSAGLAACSHAPVGEPAAAADLHPTQGNTAAGTVNFKSVPEGVQVTARITGLKPLQEHGFHVHEFGDCSSPDAMSAGGHFNPLGRPHASTGGHAGDMPNLKADVNGMAEAKFTVTGMTLASGAATDILGKAVIVHANADDYTSQPAGNSGPRLACGVIRLR